MKFFRTYKRAEMMHPAYGVVAERYKCNEDLCCWLPFNLILRPLYLLWLTIHYFPRRTRLEHEVTRIEKSTWVTIDPPMSGD